MRDGALQAVEIRHRLLRLGGRGKDGAWLRLHDLEPVVDIARMIGVRLDGNAEPGAEKRCTDFGAGFLKAVGIVAEAFAELAIETMRGTSPMGRFVAQHRIPGLGTRNGHRHR